MFRWLWTWIRSWFGYFSFFVSTGVPEEEPSPERCPEESPHRELIVNELLETEEAYTDTLKTFVETTIKPILEPSNNFSESLETTKIFQSVISLSETHKKFYGELALLVSEKQSVASLFIQYEEEFKLRYSDYIKNFESLKRFFERRRAVKDEFDETLKEQTENNADHSVDSVLIMPVQRLPRYEMMLNDLLEHTAQELHDKKKIEDAVDSMKSIIEHMNNEKRIAEQQNEIMKIQEKLTHDSNVLVKRGRFLVKSGKLSVEGKFKPLIYFLFNDMLLLVRESALAKIGNLIHVSGTKYKERDRCNLAKIELIRTEDEHLIRLQTERHAWLFCFEDVESRNEWITLIEETKENNC